LTEPQARFNPFPGLRSFEADEDHLFFGREAQIDELLRRLRTTRFLAVVGTSGSGKSSLVRAGLVPSLYGGLMSGAGSRWRIAVVRPGEDPIGRVARGLAAPDVLGGSEGDPELERVFLETTLRGSELGLVDAFRQARLPAADHLLVVVDQFEELFRFKQSRGEGARDQAVAFVKLLLEAARAPQPIYVVLTLRADFIGNCMELPGLPEAINAGQYLVPRMTREELRRAIEGPVAVGGATIAQRLVMRLLNDVGDDPDQLPVLQHALLRTWDEWARRSAPGEPIDLEHYEAVGTLKEALSRHAEEAFAELAGEREREIAESVFKRLTDRGTDGRGIRRPSRLGELAAVAGASEAQVAAVVERFRRPGRSFLMPPADVPLASESIVDISHESLMRVWTRLEEWSREEARAAQFYLRLSRAAEHHAEGVAGLWRDPELALGLQWLEEVRPTPAWAERYHPGLESALAFLDESRRARDAYLASLEKERQRKLRRARAAAAALGSAALLTLAFGAFALVQKSQAEDARLDAVRQKELAEERSREVLAQKQVADAQRRRAEEQQGIAEQQQGIAEQEHEEAEAARVQAEEQRTAALAARSRAEASESEALSQKGRAEEAQDRAEGARTEALRQRDQAETAKREADAASAETARLRGLALAQALALESSGMREDDERDLAALLAVQAYRLGREHDGPVEDPDVYAGLARALDRYWPGPPGVVHRLGSAVRALALGPDGSTLAAGSEGGELLLLDPRSPAAGPRSLGTFPGGVRALAFSPAGDLLAAGSFDGALRVWEPGRPEAPPRELPGHPGGVTALAFRPGDGLLASGGADGAIRLWDPKAGPDESRRLDGGGPVAALAFGPGGRLAAAGAAGVRVWDLPRAEPRLTLPCSGGAAKALAWSPDGGLLACGSRGGPIELHDLGRRGSADPVRLTGHTAAVNALAFLSDRRLLASAGSDGRVRLWHLAEGGSTTVIELADHESWVWTLAATPDGGRLLTGGEDRTIRARPTRSARLAEEVCRRLSRDLTPAERAEFLAPGLPTLATCPGAAS
jgi:energy-coupling factor transporter ATP-binding protein EcfA2